MSTARGGGDVRGARGAARGTSRGRGRGNAASTGDRPAQQVYAPGARGRGRGTSAPNATRGSLRGGARGGHLTVDHRNGPVEPSQAAYGGTNTTPFDPQDHAKRLEFIRERRPRLRERFIKERRMNPEGQMRLSDSVSLVGICTDMCPEFERVRRIVEDDVKPPECTPETEHLPRKQRIPDETRMVKAYARSAAGMDVELVSEIRSPKTCLETINHLMQRLDHDEFDFLHGWIWDRTRAVRKDLRTQRIKSTSDIAIYLECLERSARFLLLSTHHMARSAKDDYSHQQDIEQLNATLMSLKERYVDNRRIGNPSQNEAEFYAYRLILAPIYTNTQLENELNALPLDLRNNPRVKVAIEIFRMLKSIIFHKSQYFVQVQANWKRFWELVRSPSVSYLMACAAEVSFQRVRHVVLDTLWRVYRIGTSAKPRTVDSWTIDPLRDVLGLDTDKESVSLCEEFGFEFSVNASGHTFLDICKKGYSRSPLGKPDELKPQTFSQRIVEDKRYNRALSAIIKGQSVRDAQKSGTASATNLSKSFQDDSNSLFIPESHNPVPNIFTPAKTTSNDATKLSPAANPFIPRAAPSTDAAVQSNPFLKARQAAAESSLTLPVSQLNVFTSAAATAAPAPSFTASKPFLNPFLPNNTPAPTAPAPATSSKANPFLPSNIPKSAAPVTSSTPMAPSSTPNFFLQVSQSAKQQASASAAATPLFNFTPASSSAQTPSFTPIGSPSTAASPPVPSEAEKRKAAEEEQRRKAEAEAQRRCAQEVEQRRQREAAERAEQQRREAEQKRIQATEEARRTAAREAHLRQEREQQERQARIRARDMAWDTFANEIMCNTDESLLTQFLQNEVFTTVEGVMQQQEEERKQQLWEERKAIGEQKQAQRQRWIKRWCMGRWVIRLEKKKKAQQAHERRRRLKDMKARRARVTEDADQDFRPREDPSNGMGHQQNLPDDFRKPTVPASARRKKRTEERRRSQISTDVANVNDERPNGSSLQLPADQAALTPVSMSNSFTSSGDYSEAYKKSKAPIDRTETDWFELRAMGLDPRRYRKRSFDSTSSDEEKQEIEVKRLKTSASTLASQNVQAVPQQPIPVASTLDDQMAQFRAVQKSFQRSAESPPQAAPHPSHVDRQSSFDGRLSLIERARQMLNKSTTSQSTASHIQHDWGRSVPNLVQSTSSAHRRAQSTYIPAASRQFDRPAYWNRTSRFVPRHLYGKGPEAIMAYRVQYGLSSPSSTRPNSIEPLAVSSPIPTQLSYTTTAPSKPTTQTQEQYSETEDDNGAEDGDSVLLLDDEDEEKEDTEMSESAEAEIAARGDGDFVPETQVVVEEVEEYEDEANHESAQLEQQHPHQSFGQNGPYFQQSYRRDELEEMQYTGGYVNGDNFGQAYPHDDQYMQNAQFAQHDLGQDENPGSDDLLEYDYSNEEGASGMEVGHNEADTEDAYDDEDDEKMGSRDAARALAHFHQSQQRLDCKPAHMMASDEEDEDELEGEDGEEEADFDEEGEEDDTENDEDEDEDEDVDEDDEPIQGGATEDDAIELSD